MSRLHKTLSLFLALSLLQFFVPVLNVAMELPCCKKQGITSGNTRCCQAEFPSRLVCCYGEPEHATHDSAPLRATLEKSPQTQIDLAAPMQLAETDRGLSLTVGTLRNSYAYNFYLTSNQRYELLATLLI